MNHYNTAFVIHNLLGLMKNIFLLKISEMAKNFASDNPVDLARLSSETLKIMLDEPDAVAPIILRKGFDPSIAKGMAFHPMPTLFVQIQGESLFESYMGNHVLSPGCICVVPSGVPFRKKPRHACPPALVWGGQVDADGNCRIHLCRNSEKCQYAVVACMNIACSSAGQSLKVILDEWISLSASSGFNLSNVDTALSRSVLVILSEIVERRTEREEVGNVKVSQCKSLIDLSLADPMLSVSQIAECIQCSSDYLSALFHKETGRKLAGYIIERKIEKAKGLLESTFLSVSEVADVCGYKHASHFTTQFKEHAGTSPSSWRKNNAF
jgi:AraC-like DNA-binding protein